MKEYGLSKRELRNITILITMNMVQGTHVLSNVYTKKKGHFRLRFEVGDLVKSIEKIIKIDK